jgi:N-acetylneuraminic acid mutarotase
MKTTIRVAGLLLGLLTTGPLRAQTLDPSLPPRNARPVAAPLATPPPAARTTATTWSPVASMGTARAQHGAVAHPNGNIYVFGGYNGSTTFSSAEAYNVSTNTWTARAAMPVAMQGMATTLGNDGNIYSFAGRDRSVYRSECYRYNPTTNAWSTIATMPQPRWQAKALTAANGLIYVFGGWNFDLGVTPGNEVQIYNPATNAWSQGAPIPVPIMGMAAVLDGAGLMHLYGGIGDSPYPALTSHYIYNPGTNAWTTGPSTPSPARGYTSGARGADGYLYLVGGDSNVGMNNGTFYDDVEYYNPATSSWNAGPALPLPLTELQTVAAGDYLYALGGLSGVDTPQSTVYRLEVPPITTWTGAVSTDWFTAGNWSRGVPTASMNAEIPAGVTRQPIIASGTAVARKLLLGPGVVFRLNGGRLNLGTAN